MAFTITTSNGKTIKLDDIAEVWEVCREARKILAGEPVQCPLYEAYKREQAGEYEDAG